MTVTVTVEPGQVYSLRFYIDLHFWKLESVSHFNGWVACDGLASHPGGVAILLVSPCWVSGGIVLLLVSSSWVPVMDLHPIQEE